MVIKVQLTTEENYKFFGVPKDTIKEIDFEEYVIGCVAGEVGNSPLEVCKTQAVACRTYAYRAIQADKAIGDSSSSAQAYRAPRAASAAYSNARQAVLETQGQLLFYNNRIISPAAFSASNGGKTVSSKKQWGGERPYLIEQEDKWDIAGGNTSKVGHGVGLSQRGTKYAVSIGKTYKEILAFYYPNTYIVENYGIKGGEVGMTEKEKIICDWTVDQKGHPYIYGGTERICTVSYRKARAAQYPEYAPAIKRNCQIMKGSKTSCNNCKWYDDDKNVGLTAFDCAQLVKKAMAQINIKLPSGASSQWKGDYWDKKGTIDSVPKDKVCCLYRATSATVMGHTGLSLGPLGITMDAHGHDYGVIESTIQKYGKWTHWAIPKGFYSNDDTSTIPTTPVEEEIIKMLYQVKVTSNGTLRLRKTPSTTGVILTALPSGAILDVLEETSSGWTKVAYKAYIGYVSNSFIQKVESTTAEPTFYLKIAAANQADAQSMLDMLKRLANGSVVSS